MTDQLTVLVAPRSLAALGETLRDWVHGDLVGPYVWVTAEAVVDRAVPMAFVDDQGAAHHADLTVLAGTRAYSRVRILELVDLDSPDSARRALSETSAGARVWERLNQTFGGVPVVPVRVLLTTDGSDASVPAPRDHGWNHVLVSPEDTASPGVGYSPIDGSDPGRLVVQRAAQVAALGGLWAGVEESPVDALAAEGGSGVRISRAFFRRLTGEDVEAGLRASLFDLSTEYPRPHPRVGRTIDVEAPVAAAGHAANTVWQAFGHLLQGPREQVPASRSEEVGFGEALRMFFSFVWAALRGAPAAWARNLVGRTKSSIATSVQHFVFGIDRSAYTVVVDGHRADGSPAAWQDIQSASGAIARSLPEHGQPVREDHSALWREFVHGGLTLADAGDRSSVLPAIEVGGQRAVIRDPEQIAPSDAERFPALSGALGASIGATQPVRSVDVFQVNALGSRLQAEAGRGSATSHDAAGAFSRLAAWRERTAGSYVNQFGEILAQALFGRQAELSGILSRLQEAARPDEAADRRLAEVQKRLSMHLLGWSIGFFLAIAAVVVLWSLGVFGWGWGVGLLVGLVLSWILTGFLVFFRGQQETFRILHRRRELLGAAEVDRANLTHVITDIDRLSDVYGQYLVWSDVLGRFLRHPFGSRWTVGTAGGAEFTDLPRGTAQARVSPGDEVVDEAAHVLRHDLFPVGWLSEQWTSFLAQAPGLLGPAGMEIAQDPRQLYRMRAGARDGLLHAWLQALDTTGTDPAMGDAMWERAKSRLAAPDRQELTSRLLGSARTAEGTAVPVESFFGRVGVAAAADLMNASYLSATARGRSAQAVDQEFVRTRSVGLGRGTVHVQLTAPVEIQHFDFFTTGARTTGTDPDVPATPPATPFGDLDF
ncbi:hypothetical protein [Brevibacterium litoralis]|uniref:hypothetical protein n=1 Tax=Brevibacterium litoralis TaxID=3138935 RepID=UPI0032EE7F93